MSSPHIAVPSILLLLLLAPGLGAAPRVLPVPVPPPMRSSAFTVTVNGIPVDVAHAAANYEFASFDITGPVEVAITAAEPGFWDRGVDIQPWRLGLRARREGQTIRLRLKGAAKLSISRPRDFLNHAAMLFLFAGARPPAPPAGPRVHYYPPGVYHQSLNPASGDIYYLAPGAFFFGSLNLWRVENVRVMGRGTIVYDGPQDPATDEGWMQRPDWHCIGMMEARDIEVDGVTCVIRSRTWSVQMKDSLGIVYDDLRVIGGNPGNANQDGMDWIGSGRGLVRNSFFRASDDVIALMGNWDGYHDEDMLRPGRDVEDITVEDSELSTSISNVVRSGWPRKIFNSRNFTLRNSDILHGGIGACGQPFALLGMWASDGARGDHSGYTFENLFLDDWYSLVQMEQEQPRLHGFLFRNIWALDQPPLVDSSLRGAVAGVTLQNVKYGQERISGNAQIPLAVAGGAAQPQYLGPAGPEAAFTVDPPVFAPGDRVTFTASPARHARYTWRFGDGTGARGRRVRHRFPDALGTDLDGTGGAGRFRVLLEVRSKGGHRRGGREGDRDWAAQGVVAVAAWHDAVRPDGPAGPVDPGLRWRILPGGSPTPEAGAPEGQSSSPSSVAADGAGPSRPASGAPALAGESATISLDAQGLTRYAARWDGFIEVPADGGYTFHLLARDGARLAIDGIEVARTGPPFAEVCGAEGNAVRYDRGAIGLRRGLHAIHLEGMHSGSQGLPRLLWEGPGIAPSAVPASAFRHLRTGVVGSGAAGADAPQGAGAGERSPQGRPSQE